MKLWHYTCEHAASRIDADGMLRPQASWWTLDTFLVNAGLPRTGLRGPGVIWLTDLDVPDAPTLGLESVVSPCDRTEARFAIDTDDAVPWLTWRMLHLPRPEWVRLIEQPPHDPASWWVHEGPIATVRA